MIRLLILFLALHSSISFGQTNKQCQTTTDSSGINYVTVPEIEPEFPGGMGEMFVFIESNVILPELEESAAGIVYTSFIINTDGTLSNFSAFKSFHPEYSKAAIDVLKKMPNWTPGKCNGEAVNVRYTLPLRFM
jgi:protein TonB